MKKATFPGFTADASLYKTTKHYHMAEMSGVSANWVIPQQLRRMAGQQLDRKGICDAACVCCGLPSPIEPECCGVCLACGICDLTGWCASPSAETIGRIAALT
jgi:hypothetical protein